MNNIIPKTEWIRTWTENGVGWIQLSHDNKLNPLSASFILAIKDAAEKFDNDPSIGCIVLIGSDKAFAAGADLKEMIKLSRMQQENEGAKDRNVDNMYIKQAEHMLRTKMYEAGVSYIMKALEINPESQVNIQIVAFVQTN